MENREGKKEVPFESSDIEDVRIIIKAKGKNWAITPKKDCSTAKEMRIYAGLFALEYHYIVTPALEDIDTKKYESKLKNE